MRGLWFRLRGRLIANYRVSRHAWIKGHANVSIGAGSKIDAFSSLDAGLGRIAIGSHCTVNRYAMLQAGRGNVTLGDRVEVNNYSIVNGSGGVCIGNDTLIGPGCGSSPMSTARRGLS